MTTTATHLRTIALTWPRLRDALDTRTSDTWPPAGRMADHLTDLDMLDVPQRGARDGSGAGESPAPLRVHILDTMQRTETALLAVADQTAERVQRRLITVDTGRGWTDRVHREVALLAARDAADPQRWPLRGDGRGPVRAALWLCARVEGLPGPCRPLTPQQHDRIASVAAAEAARIERALQLTRHTVAVTGLRCACTGIVELHGGDGQPPVARCSSCGWTLTPNTPLVA